MIRWDPWGDLSSLHNTLDRVFGEASHRAAQERPSLHLPVNIKETETDYRIQAPVPGFAPEQIEVTFTEGTLTIRAQHPEETAAEEGEYVRRELARGNLLRQIGFSGQIQDADIKASVENGLLEVTVPKEPRAQPKRISVSGTGGSKQLT